MQGVAKLAKVLECGAKPSAHGAAVLLLVVLVLHSVLLLAVLRSATLVQPAGQRGNPKLKDTQQSRKYSAAAGII